ncbi:DUF2931 family protein [Flavobacterium sp. ZT3R18]|uniref:DUF2931 family protein n=1 Tax=Flavobacterium sp. ZT3R18 TaxID=2594429 RepID=UPI00163D7623|nr:DUF2931 family protein [Flavobacterium sp. ZT3R18]
MTKLLKSIILGMMISITVCCQNKQQNNMLQNKTNLPEFDWKANVNCPPGYPVEVYRGGLEGNGSYASLDSGTATGKSGWGFSGKDVSYGVKSLPSRINCIWVSYAEGCFYSIDSPIDYDKMLHLFQEGYQNSAFYFNGNGEYKKMTFSTIIVGFAPGGVVVIWAMGGGRQVEIGRYKGEKYQVSQAEIQRLDSHESLLFSKDEYKRIMLNTQIVPLEVREANAGKPIPYGLWDSYRVRYTWRSVFAIKKEVEITSIICMKYNGEKELIFDKNLAENKFSKQAIPKFANLSWTDWTVNSWTDKKGQGYGGEITFDEQEITQAYQEMYKDDKEGQAELQFSINHINTFVTVQLKQGDKEIRLGKTIVKVYKSKSLSLKK